MERDEPLYSCTFFSSVVVCSKTLRNVLVGKFLIWRHSVDKTKLGHPGRFSSRGPI